MPRSRFLTCPHCGRRKAIEADVMFGDGHYLRGVECTYRGPDGKRCGADVPAAALTAVRKAAKRGYTTHGLARCTQLRCATYLGWLRRDKRAKAERYTVTRAGQAALDASEE